jgi:hypothetical protein
MSTTKVRYIGPFAAVEVPLDHRGNFALCPRGEVVELPTELVLGVPGQGEPPSLENDLKGSDDWVPERGGLLDQEENWERVGRARRQKDDEPPAEPPTDTTTPAAPETSEEA